MPVLAEYIQEFGRFQRNARLYLISNALGGVTVGIILVLYNLYLVSLGYGADFIGLVLFVGTVGAGIAIFPAGECVDRFGGKAILIWSSLLIAVAGAGQMLFRQPLPLLVSAFVAGIGAAFVLVVNAPFLTANSTPAERSLLFSFNIVVGLITTVLGELLGGALPIWLRMVSWLMAPLPPWLAWILSSHPLARSYQLAMLAAGVIAAPSMVPLFLLSDDRPAGHEQGVTSAAGRPQGIAPTILRGQANAVYSRGDPLRSPW
ncbi:MAG: MFS transporter, partial [Chloroflexi bacterium]|nr:MFS transporter [Chloroflexota bacterium]